MKTLLIFFLASFLKPTPDHSGSSLNLRSKNRPMLYVKEDVVIQTSSGPVTLRSGTAVVVESSQTYYSKNLTEGQTINVRVKYNVVTNKKTAIAAGALGTATVSEVKKPRGFGGGGRLEVQVQSVQAVDGQQILLSGIPNITEGGNRKGLAWGLSIGLFLFTLVGGAIGFFIKGKDAELKAGTTINSSVASDSKIDIEEEDKE
jgi:hypothetical protein